jgi:predicted NBD/HSP70 family sugar kinase
MVAGVQNADTSAGEIFQLIRRGGVSTRTDLISVTGLSRSTISQRLDSLLAAGYITEGGKDASTGGRPPGVLVPNENAKTILAADLGATHGRLAVLDGAAKPLIERTIETRIETGPDAVLDRVCEGLAELLEDSHRKRATLCGIGIGVPGPMDVKTGRPIQPPIMPGWHGYPIRDSVQARFPTCVLVENDANLMALAEWQRVYPEAHSLVFVKVATGIGAGIVIDGQVYDGVDGGAGDIGHIKIPAAARHRCNCGADGCLAAVASGSAIARALRKQGCVADSSRDVVRLVQSGVAEALAATREAGRLIGGVLATAVSLLNPGVLVLGGDMAQTNEHFLMGLREVLYQQTQPLATRSLLVASSRLGDRAGILGGAILVREHVFSPASVNGVLSGRQP